MRIKKGYFSSNLLRKFETKACKENLPDNMQFKSLKEEHPLLPSESRSVCKERLSASEKNRKLQQKFNETNPHSLQADHARRLDALGKENHMLRLKWQQKSKNYQGQTVAYEKYIEELNVAKQQQQKVIDNCKKELKELRCKANRYAETIKEHIYWLMQVFMAVNEGKGVSVLVGQVVSAFSLLNNYIEELGIEKQLKGMEAVQLMQKYGRTQFSQQNCSGLKDEARDALPNNPFLETFNQEDLFPEVWHDGDKMERITRRLFDSQAKSQQSAAEEQSVLSQQSSNGCLPHKAEQHLERDLPFETTICKSFQPVKDQENFIVLKKGDTVKLLRRIKENLWVGECEDRIGYLLADYLA